MFFLQYHFFSDLVVVMVRIIQYWTRAMGEYEERMGDMCIT